MLTHRLALGTVAAAHLGAAGVLAWAGVPVVSIIVLTLAGVAALVLGLIGPTNAADRRGPRRRRRDRYRMGPLQATGRSVDSDPAA